MQTVLITIFVVAALAMKVAALILAYLFWTL